MELELDRIDSKRRIGSCPAPSLLAVMQRRRGRSRSQISQITEADGKRENIDFPFACADIKLRGKERGDEASDNFPHGRSVIDRGRGDKTTSSRRDEES